MSRLEPPQVRILRVKDSRCNVSRRVTPSGTDIEPRPPTTSDGSRRRITVAEFLGCRICRRVILTQMCGVGSRCTDGVSPRRLCIYSKSRTSFDENVRNEIFIPITFVTGPLDNRIWEPGKILRSLCFWVGVSTLIKTYTVDQVSMGDHPRSLQRRSLTSLKIYSRLRDGT